jgi:predicted TIM-barrel fold metal-dependent hydrolase
MIIDAQVHVYERDRPERPWAAVLHGPAEVTGADMVAAMAAAGVDAAVLVSPYTMYRFDESYALATHATYPGKFCLVKPVDPEDPAVGETIRAWKGVKGAVAVRLMMTRGMSEDPANPGINRVLAEAGRAGLAVNLLCYGRMAQVRELARRNPDTQLVIDHVGLTQPFEPPPLAEPWADLENVLSLAACPNVALKITGACTLSRGPYPYHDIWDPLWRLFDAYSLDRCLWGTDWTRAVEILTYKQGVDAFLTTPRLSAEDRERLMSATLQRVYRWRPGG